MHKKLITIYAAEVKVGQCVVGRNGNGRVTQIHRCDGYDAELMLAGGEGLKTAAAIEFQFSDGSKAAYHPMIRVQIA